METDQLRQWIDRKHEVLLQLRDLSRRQLALVRDENDAPPLMSLLAAKQQLIHRLTGIEKQLDPFRAQDPDSRCWPSPDDRRRCAEKADRCTKLLEEIMRLEKQGMADLTERRDDAAARLRAVTSAAQACRAYHEAPAEPTRHLDLLSEW